MDFQTLLYTSLNIVVTSINLMGVVIVIWGFVVAAIGFIRMKLHAHNSTFFIANANKVRAILGTYILFGLEFMIAADLIHTFVQPTQEDLIVLATIVGIRTVISYFLTREVDEARREQNVTNKS